MPSGNNSRSKQARHGVFISYARSDGENLCATRRYRVTVLTLSKCVSTFEAKPARMEGGRDWWLQITEALNRVESMALVMTPGALNSETVRKEWRYARQQGVCIYPIKGSPNFDFAGMPA